MTALEHLQSVCPEGLGWTAAYSEVSDGAKVDHGPRSTLLIEIDGRWACRAMVGDVLRRAYDADPSRAITTACEAVVDELQRLIGGAP